MSDPTRAVEREMAELLGYATIRSGAKDLFLSLPSGLASLVASMPQDRLDPETVAMVKYTHGLIHNAFQRVALKVCGWSGRYCLSYSRWVFRFHSKSLDSVGE